MSKRLLICSDLDRTLLPNGPEPESPTARQRFARLAQHPEVVVAYVSGRDRALVEQAIDEYELPIPDYVVGDVGSTIYTVGTDLSWEPQASWEAAIGHDWNGLSHVDLNALLNGLPDLRLQEPHKQNRFKLSYFLPLDSDRQALAALIQQRFEAAGVKANLIWSVDDPLGLGLLDILPAQASKYHALAALMKTYDFDRSNTVFCGDSGNDIEVLSSDIPSVLVANSKADVRQLAQRLAKDSGNEESLYLAQGGFMGMNGNYSGGMLEGIAHYHPWARDWIDDKTQTKGA